MDKVVFQLGLNLKMHILQFTNLQFNIQYLFAGMHPKATMPVMGVPICQGSSHF